MLMLCVSHFGYLLYHLDFEIFQSAVALRGSLSYNAQFEKGVLKRLAELFSDLSEHLMATKQWQAVARYQTAARR